MSNDEVSEQTPLPAISHPEEGEGNALCFQCLAEIGDSDSFCSSCGAPVGSFATVGPIEHIHAAGFMARRSSKAPIKGWMFWFAWTLGFLLYIPAVISFVVTLLESGGGSVFVTGAFMVLYAAVLAYLAVDRLRKKTAVSETGEE